MTHQPTVDRPIAPDGYGVPETTEGVMAWESVRERLAHAKNFWICTASLKGRPHATPLWGAWVDDSLYFDGALTTRWGRNLSANPYIEVHLESGNEVVIVEGMFSQTNDLTPEAFERVQASYKSRYESYQPETREQLYQVRPQKVLAWTKFPTDMTRFKF
jgi:nitroimidazol reductase NimA-like FMN-containing flavoprotein (pyridoxamine 5'-phosphate oxidase superfamily)